MKNTLQRIKKAGALSINDALILDNLNAHGEAFIDMICAKSGIGYNTIQACLARLMGYGLVSRRRSGMAHVYRLTESGKEVFLP